MVACTVGCTSSDATDGWEFDATTDARNIRTDTGPSEGDTSGTADVAPDDTGGGSGGEDAACQETAPSTLRNLRVAVPSSTVGPGDVFAATGDGLFYTAREDRRDARSLVIGHADVETGERELLTAGGRTDSLVDAGGNRGLIVQEFRAIRADDRAAPSWLAGIIDTDGSVRTIPDLRKTEQPSEFDVRGTSFDGERAVFALRGVSGTPGASFDYYDGEETHPLRYDRSEPYPYPSEVALVEEGFVTRLEDTQRTPATRLVRWSSEEGWKDITEVDGSGRRSGFTAAGRDLFWYENSVVLHRDLESGQTSRLDQLDANGGCTFSNLEASRALLTCTARVSQESVRSLFIS